MYIRYANGVNLSAVLENTALVQGIRCELYTNIYELVKKQVSISNIEENTITLVIS